MVLTLFLRFLPIRGTGGRTGILVSGDAARLLVAGV
ncbi:hypothetical protein FHX09_005049 [Rhizobium sp. BK538]|nr:hypothetical protein [Rhizobium sp. BK060]MBB4171162.1 hypothetical protein [Rhizobium sp. BK538]TCM69693.1 hypothetical protein EV291_12651 [Rhizobium sp. BK068]